MWLTESDAVLQERTIVIKGAAAAATTASSQALAAATRSSTVARRRNGEHGEDPVARQPGAIQTKNVTTQACCPDGMAWYDRLNWLISMGPRIYNHVVWSLENRQTG